MYVGSNTLNEEYKRALHHKIFFPCFTRIVKKGKVYPRTGDEGQEGE